MTNKIRKNIFKNKLSIIVPTFNRYQKLCRLIASIVKAFPLPDLPNIFIIDDGSTDETASLESISKENLTVFHASRGGAARARNIGSYFNKTEYLLFVDDDCIFPVNYKNFLTLFFLF